MFKRILAVLVVLALSISMVGCLDIEEKVALKNDGTTFLTLKVRLMMEGKGVKSDSTDIQDLGKGISGIEVVESSTKSIYGQTISIVTIKGSNFSAIKKAFATLPKGDKQEQKDIGEVFSEKGFYNIKAKGNRLVITRTINKINMGDKAAKGKKKKDDFGAEMASMMFGGIAMRFDLEVPTKVISSNAENQDGNTLHWVIPLSYLQKNKVTLQAEIESTPELTKSITGK